MEGAQDEQQAREGGVRRDGLEPVVVHVEQDLVTVTVRVRVRVRVRFGVGVRVRVRLWLDVEADHLGLGRLEDQVAELLDLEARLEGQLQLGALDHDVGEVEQVHLVGVRVRVRVRVRLRGG